MSSTGLLIRGEGCGEWSQDCLACLLKLLCELGVRSSQLDIVHDYVSDAQDTPKKKVRKVRKRTSEKLIITQLSQVMLDMMEVHILLEASQPHDGDDKFNSSTSSTRYLNKISFTYNLSP